MKQCGYHEVRIVAACSIGYQHCDFHKMIDIWLLGRPLPTLVYVPSRGRISRFEYL
jgi:hypothetical protein